MRALTQSTQRRARKDSLQYPLEGYAEKIRVREKRQLATWDGWREYARLDFGELLGDFSVYPSKGGIEKNP
jgi:hypothetical protein